MEETARFNKSLEDGQNEWNYLFPPGGGAYVVGKQQRVLINAMYHQLHCVEGFSTNIRRTSPTSWSHVRHCLEYILALSLCQADVTLEPGDFGQHDFYTERMGAERVCRDWEEQYHFVRENFARYLETLTYYKEGDSSKLLMSKAECIVLTSRKMKRI